ncbi:methylmalonic aciduria and homocystinuria type D homolog, mitochondrial isoform X1 [Apis dorsata]|uniref:methylmalonic aciduria and homocystinuria type D homolog, mitochondrial isoform X1 n=1 Tax=Apis dorsata TaxID=7462 RepID=UPI0003DF52EA|nr:methylmalonic aciduria and homocystinuria type D homolog, mitochondrial isoform X1 [Apis dorsata]XP_031370179.1 methylmalonic aciduria and homocystinuria type D homolog, mitochondrial isoform X1 [Apis dorsata]XP_031370180.1 methylmalonic aciduria and homocystinuria type D homolog, mitochondrial isoform X1 [Apis dorsata]
MLCVKYVKKNNTTILFNILSKGCYSRRSNKSTNSYKIVQANSENLNDVDGAMLGINSNWELLTPRGFRFYLPGSIGPGWSDVTTTIQVRTQLVDFHDNDKQISIDDSKEKSVPRSNRLKGTQHSMLHCVAQECPLLLRKGIEELFPGCLDVGSPQLTIITISQSINFKVMKWNKEIETEKLAKYFVLAASDICAKLRRMGYWADFINPFSGQPHLNLQKNNTLYKTDERFRCLGFKILHRNNCKIILYDNNAKNFLVQNGHGTVVYITGNLYTTAPASTEFLKEILYDCELVNVNEA